MELTPNEELMILLMRGINKRTKKIYKYIRNIFNKIILYGINI